MTIKNLDKLMKKLDALGGNSHKALKKGIHQGTKLVQAKAKLLAPVADIDGGRLRNSIQGEVVEQDGKISGEVSTNVEYAAYVEFGTGQRGEESPSPPKFGGDIRYRQNWKGMAAQPYLYPALKQSEQEIRAIIVKLLSREIAKLGGR
jgi:HK97 gp10 family phage protein